MLVELRDLEPAQSTALAARLAFVAGAALLCGQYACCCHGLMTIRRFARFAAWTGLAVIIFVTVERIGARPSTITSAALDRAIAFVVMSALFVIAYPRRILPITLALLLAAFLFELGQYVSLTRHPHLHDALVKAVGVLVGVSAGWLTNFMSRRGEKLL